MQTKNRQGGLTAVLVQTKESSARDIHNNNNTHIDFEKAVKRFLDVNFRGLCCQDVKMKLEIEFLVVFTDTNKQCTTTIAIIAILKSEVNLILLDLLKCSCQLAI